MRYDVVVLNPDNERGQQALHEYLQEGWEVACQWQESWDTNSPSKWINHIALRRPTSPTKGE